MQLIETLISAAGPLDRTEEAIYVAEKLVSRYRSFFAHVDGGLIFARSINPGPHYKIDLSVCERTWWVQTEASRAFLLLALLCPDDTSHREAFARQWSFVEGHMVDRRFHGFFESAEEGRKTRQWLSPFHASSRKTHMWKDVSHEAHFLMDAIGWLRGGLSA
jgi:mannose/cellobiose epimerase-like protein (N-acyl-D-glucosamine 2-epimerase family)